MTQQHFIISCIFLKSAHQYFYFPNLFLYFCFLDVVFGPLVVTVVSAPFCCCCCFFILQHYSSGSLRTEKASASSLLGFDVSQTCLTKKHPGQKKTMTWAQIRINQWLKQKKNGPWGISYAKVNQTTPGIISQFCICSSNSLQSSTLHTRSQCNFHFVFLTYN